jgi:hypothetical protein
MGKKLLLSIALSFSGLLVFFVFTNLLYPDGAPAGVTGSPTDGQTCGKSNCHNATPTTVTGWITSNVPVEGWSAGVTYTVTVTVTGSGAKGFEVSPQNISGTLLGTLIAGTGNKLTGSEKYVTHSSDLNTNPGIWTFQWTAPAAGTGTVTFYGAFVSGFSNVFTSTLAIEESTVSIKENNFKANSFKINSNPVRDKLDLTYYLEKASNVKINIYSYDGKKIASLLDEKVNSGNYIKSFSLPFDMIKGLYFVKFERGDETSIKKLLKL